MRQQLVKWRRLDYKIVFWLSTVLQDPILYTQSSQMITCVHICNVMWTSTYDGKSLQWVTKVKYSLNNPLAKCNYWWKSVHKQPLKATMVVNCLAIEWSSDKITHESVIHFTASSDSQKELWILFYFALLCKLLVSIPHLLNVHTLLPSSNCGKYNEATS